MVVLNIYALSINSTSTSSKTIGRIPLEITTRENIAGSAIPMTAGVPARMSITGSDIRGAEGDIGIRSGSSITNGTFSASMAWILD